MAKRLDQSKPPPGWVRVDSDGWKKEGFCMLDPPLGYAVEEGEARRWTEQVAQPYVDDALAQVVEFLQADASESRDDRYCNGVQAAIDAIESGEWRK